MKGVELRMNRIKSEFDMSWRMSGFVGPPRDGGRGARVSPQRSVYRDQQTRKSPRSLHPLRLYTFLVMWFHKHALVIANSTSQRQPQATQDAMSRPLYLVSFPCTVFMLMQHTQPRRLSTPTLLRSEPTR